MAITTPVNRGSAAVTTNSVSCSVNCSGAAAEGNLLLYSVSAIANTAATLTSVTGGGATWAVEDTINNGNSVLVGIAWCIIPAGGIADTSTITGTISTATNRKAMALVEIGVDGGWAWPADPTDVHTHATGTDTDSFSTGTTGTTTAANALVYCADAHAGNVTAFTAGTGFTVAPFNSSTGLLVVSSGSTPRSLLGEYKIVSAAGTQGDTDTNTIAVATGVYAAAVTTWLPTVFAGSTSTKAGSGAWGSAG